MESPQVSRARKKGGHSRQASFPVPGYGRSAGLPRKGSSRQGKKGGDAGKSVSPVRPTPPHDGKPPKLWKSLRLRRFPTAFPQPSAILHKTVRHFSGYGKAMENPCRLQLSHSLTVSHNRARLTLPGEHRAGAVFPQRPPFLRPDSFKRKEKIFREKKNSFSIRMASGARQCRQRGQA